MSKASFNLNNFLTSVKTRGLAKVNRFEVIISPPKALLSFAVQEGDRSSKQEAELSSLFCEVSNFPPINLTVKPFKIFGPSYQRPITSEYGGDGMSMTFHIDKDMLLKRFFEDWIENIVRRDDFTVNYQDSYVTNILIRQLDEGSLGNEAPYSTLTDDQGTPLANLEDERNKLNIKYEIELIEAFPRSMTLVDLNNSAQNQTHRLNIIFAYRYWRRTDIQDSIQIVPKVSLQTQPILVPIRETETSRVLAALGNQEEPNVDFSDSTFSTPSA
jgi:hypothetical protein